MFTAGSGRFGLGIRDATLTRGRSTHVTVFYTFHRATGVGRGLIVF